MSDEARRATGAVGRAPAPSVALILLGGLLALVGLAGVAQVAVDLAAREPEGQSELHIWAALATAPGALILAIGIDPRRANHVAVSVAAGILFGLGLGACALIAEGWRKTGMAAIGTAIGLNVLSAVAAIGVILLLFRRRPR